MVRTIGTAAYGLRAPIVKQGDDLAKIVVDTVLNSGLEIKDRDVLGITESIVARNEGNYVTLDEVAGEIKNKLDNPSVILVNCPIYSRNRFAMILKAIARAAGKVVAINVFERDYVGNVLRDHPFTGLNYDEYYKSIIEAEGKKCVIVMNGNLNAMYEYGDYKSIYCGSIHEYDPNYEYKEQSDITLADICSDDCEYGLYGSNKSSEELLKLFPSKDNAQRLVENIQTTIEEKTGKKIEVMVYGDGCFKDPVGGIWEFADPAVSPAYTKGLEGTPNEIKIKNFADEKFKDLHGKELDAAIVEEIRNKASDLKGNMYAQGTTPRRYTDLLGSLMDLTSGSGDKGTPFVYVQGYFDNISNE